MILLLLFEKYVCYESLKRSCSIAGPNLTISKKEMPLAWKPVIDKVCLYRQLKVYTLNYDDSVVDGSLVNFAHFCVKSFLFCKYPDEENELVVLV